MSAIDTGDSRTGALSNKADIAEAQEELGVQCLGQITSQPFGDKAEKSFPAGSTGYDIEPCGQCPSERPSVGASVGRLLQKDANS